MDVALLHSGQHAAFEGPFMAYLTKGKGTANGTPVADGDLMRGDGISFEAFADDDGQLKDEEQQARFQGLGQSLVNMLRKLAG